MAVETIKSETWRYRRVVVGLDTGAGGRSSLRVAARLAQAAHARLTGIYVAQAELMSLAALPVARQLSFSGAAVAISPEDMRRSMRAEAERARAMLAEAAREARVDWAFDQREGDMPAEISGSAEARDLVVFRLSPELFGPLCEAVKRAVMDARADVLILGRKDTAPGLLTPMPGRGGPRPLILAVTTPETSALVQETTTLLARSAGLDARYVDGESLDSEAFAALCQSWQPALAVAPATFLPAPDKGPSLAADAGVPALLLGGGSTTEKNAQEA